VAYRYLQEAIHHRGWFRPRDFLGLGGQGSQVRLHKGITRAFRTVQKPELRGMVSRR